MSTLRRVNRLNRKLWLALGENPRFAWLNTASPELQHPMQVFRDGQPVWDYLCGCGRNKSIHAASCSGAIRAVPAIRVGPRLPEYPDRWVFCFEHHVDLAEFVGVMGTEGHYRPTLWVPQGVAGVAAPGFIIRKREPTEENTDWLIAAIKDFRSQKPREWREELEEKHRRRDAKVEETAELAARETLGVTLFPWEKSDTSFPAVQRKDHGNDIGIGSAA